MPARSRSDVVKWLVEPQEHDYPAAASYLSLVFAPKKVAKLVAALKAAPVEKFKAKDIFRASRLSLLGISNSHVENYSKRIKRREQLSPLLLVRDTANRRVIVADGYHRLCAVYIVDENALIPCKLV